MVRLKIYDGALKVREAELGPHIVTLGREEGNSIVLADASVSRRHIAIEPTGTFFLMRDLCSTNGTFVNEMLVRTHLLGDGDVLRIGKYVLRFDARAERHQDSTQVRVEKLHVPGLGPGSAWDPLVEPAPDTPPGQEELESLLELQSRIGLLDEVHHILDLTLEILLVKLRAQRGSVLLCKSAKLTASPVDEFFPITARCSEDVRNPDEELVVHEDILRESLTQPGGVVAQPAVDLSPSVIAVPLQHGGLVRGVIYLEREPAQPPFQRQNLGFLAAVSRFAALSMLNCELRAEANRNDDILQAVLTRVEDGLIVTDRDFLVVAANPASRALLGCQDIDPLGVSMFKLCSKLTLVPGEEALRNILPGGETEFELRQEAAGGAFLRAKLTDYAVKGKDPGGFLLTLRNVPRQEQNTAP